MIIEHSNLQLASQRSAMTHVQQRESMTAWRDGPQGRTEVRQEVSREALQVESAGYRVSLSPGALAPRSSVAVSARADAGAGAGGSPAANSHGAAPIDEIDATDSQDSESLKLAVLIRVVEQLTGREVRVARLSASDFARAPDAGPGDLAPAQRQPAPAQDGWGVSYEYQETRVEAEDTRFRASGVVRTADGKEIDLAIELNMSRRFVSQTNVSARLGDAAKDPLVINFGGQAAALTEDTFRFDLDVDGRMDEIASLAPGSGYLAVDRNGDGVINDGSELFGPRSGDGFAELADFDDDGNGWIDERDAIFSRLVVWTRNEDGEDQLQGLLQLGIGAVHLGRAQTEFALRDGSNNSLGQVRSTGVFLYESGGVGTVQQIDLVV